MLARTVLASMLLLTGCGGSSPPIDPAGLCRGVAPTGTYPDQPVAIGDARYVASVHCESTDPSNDFVGDLVETSHESGVFALTFHRTRPTLFDRSDCVTALFSGHVFEFTNASKTMGLQANPEDKPGELGWLNDAWVQDQPNTEVTELANHDSLRCWGVHN